MKPSGQIDAPAAAGAHSNPVDQLAALGQQRRYAARALLIQEGDHGDNIYVIVRGRLRVFSSDNKGKEITLGVYGAGEYVGEMALDGGPRSASVEAQEPTLCSVVTREKLRGYIAANPDFAFDMMARLIRRARLATDSARSLALIDVYGRLTRLLDELAIERQADGSRRIAERMTHQEIANRVVCSREMVSRLLKDLELGGYVELVERRLVLRKPLPARW
jgi:CRP/FNR family cyclic AMP-dependent transcriptional regulator